jgi:hypothetical protein
VSHLNNIEVVHGQNFMLNPEIGNTTSRVTTRYAIYSTIYVTKNKLEKEV